MLNIYVNLNSSARDRLGIDGGRVVKVDGEQLVIRKNLKYYFINANDLIN